MEKVLLGSVLFIIGMVSYGVGLHILTKHKINKVNSEILRQKEELAKLGIYIL